MPTVKTRLDDRVVISSVLRRGPGKAKARLDDRIVISAILRRG